MNVILIILGIFTEQEFNKLKNRDTECIERLYCTYKKRIFNYLLFKLNNNEDAAYDILSDTFVAVLTSVPKLDNL